jgi:hypothetical protein
MIHIFSTKTGNYEIPIPDGYSIVADGQNIQEGDLCLVAGNNYNYSEYLPTFTPFAGLDLGSRVVDSSMLIIRQNSIK